MLKKVAVVLFLTTVAVGCKWVPTSVSAPSDGVVYAGMAKRAFFSYKGVLVRCERGSECVEIWSDK